MIRYGIDDLYPDSKGYDLKYRLERGWIVRARPDLVFIERGLRMIFIEFKISGYLPGYPGILVNAMEFAHQVRYYNHPTIHFTYAKNLNKWFVFSTDGALKNMLYIQHISEIPVWMQYSDELTEVLRENIENRPIIHQLLPQVKFVKKDPTENMASNKDSLVLDIKKIKQLDHWLDRLS